MLHEQNCALKDLLIKKDIEIDQYKMEGAVLKRSLVATPRFDESKFSDGFPLVVPEEEGLNVRQLLRVKDRRSSLMKVLRIRSKDQPESVNSPVKGKILSLSLTPAKKSPGGRVKGLDAIYAKQRMPKPSSMSSMSLKRLQAESDDDEDDKPNSTSAHDDSSTSLDSSGRPKIRKITRL
ncbi:uncharacterized protein LOC129738729 [Uranotaenia lowii]|uniref:uncharacterized protein LOC129738729 n=1 Tax=Uranotaenia lowii TaxID=190385 RepID=UPI0024797A13|nr:uncharacterized protein LOC129738729 [Uranotaenia lowii]